MPVITVLLAILPIFYISLFIHECGHVVMSRWSGFAVTSFGVGTAKPLWVRDWRGVKVFLCAQGCMGLTWGIWQQIYPFRRQRALLMTGGVAANAFLAFAALGLWWLLSWGSTLWLTLAVVNILFGLLSLIPLTVQAGNSTVMTDGAHIIMALRDQDPQPTHALQIAKLRALLESVGDLRGLYDQLLSEAIVWAELGDVEYARRLNEEAHALTVDHSPFTRAYTLLVIGAVARLACDHAQSVEAYKAALDGFRVLNHETGQFLASWGRIELLITQGQWQTALLHLDALDAHPLCSRQRRLRLGLMITRARAFFAMKDWRAIAPLVARYEADPRQYRSLCGDLDLYYLVAQAQEQQGDPQSAKHAYWRALEAVRDIHLSIPTGEDRMRFVECQNHLREGAKECLRQIGDLDGLAKLDEFFPSEEVFSKGKLQEKIAHSRRLHRIGLALAALNLGVEVAIIVFFVTRNLVFPSLPNIQLIKLSLIIVFPVLLCSIASILFGLLLWIKSRIGQRVNWSLGGGITLGLALLSWVNLFFCVLSAIRTVLRLRSGT